MVMKCSAVCLVALALLGSLCEAQYNNYQRPAIAQKPSYSQQEKQTFEKPMQWKFPDSPKPEEKNEGPFEQRHPVAVESVAVECRENNVHVQVKKDMFGVGQLIDGHDLTLGSCGVAAEDSMAQVLIFEEALHSCGSSLMMTEDSIIYTYTLNYKPSSLGSSPVVRTSQAAVIVECHYPRKHNVSSYAIEPVWVPYSSVKVSEEFLYFSMTLMTEDWVYARPVAQYYLGDVINIEIGVNQFHHIPLRVYVDHCVATLSPDPNSSPGYSFIDSGCMLDGRLTGSQSKFIAREAENKLRVQLEAFRFFNSDNGMLYITCHLRAVAASTIPDASNRACYYANGWRGIGSDDSICNSCEPTGIPVPGPSTPGKATGGTTVYGGQSGGTRYGGGNTGTGTGSGTTWSGSSNPQAAQGRKTREATKKDVFDWHGVVRVGPIEIGEGVAP